MKKLSVITIFLLYGYCAAAQKQVHMNEIMSLARNYVVPTKHANGAVDTIFCEVDDMGDNVLYQILYEDTSFVLVSGNKACLPILAYGDAGEKRPIWEAAHSAQDGLSDLIEQYEAQMRYCFNNDTIPLTHQSDWDRLTAK